MTTETKERATADTSVTTLTAEVRVLMVGRRQVTLSVFRQLDTVGIDRLEPFGRVRDGDKQYLIGAEVGTGDLVRAALRSEGSIRSHPVLSALDVPKGSIQACANLGGWPANNASRPVTFGEYTVDVAGEVVARLEGCQCNSRHVGAPCSRTIMADDGVLEKIRALVNAHERVKSLHARGRSMGLIVLAGLK